MGHFDLHRRFLNAMGYSTLTLVVIVVGTMVHLPLTINLVLTQRMEIQGVAIANTITNAVMLLVQLVIAGNFIEDIKVASFWPRMAETFSLAGIRAYLAIGGPTILALCLAWWAWEMLMLLTGIWDDKQQASMVVIMNIATLFYRFGEGMDQSASAIIG